MRGSLRAPRAIGIDEIAIRKGHHYRVIVSDLHKGRPIWFGGQGRTEADIDLFFNELGARKCARIELAAMDMWKPFRNSLLKHAPNARIVFDKFHIMRHLSTALDAVRRAEYKRLSGQDRSYIKGQRYTLLSRRENLSLDGRQALTKLLKANRRLNTAYLLKESFGQLWEYKTERGARAFFERWKASLKWQRLKPYQKFARMIEAHWDGIASSNAILLADICHLALPGTTAGRFSWQVDAFPPESQDPLARCLSLPPSFERAAAF